MHVGFLIVPSPHWALPAPSVDGIATTARAHAVHAMLRFTAGLQAVGSATTTIALFDGGTWKPSPGMDSVKAVGGALAAMPKWSGSAPDGDLAAVCVAGAAAVFPDGGGGGAQRLLFVLYPAPLLPPASLQESAAAMAATHSCHVTAVGVASTGQVAVVPTSPLPSSAEAPEVLCLSTVSGYVPAVLQGMLKRMLACVEVHVHGIPTPAGAATLHLRFESQTPLWGGATPTAPLVATYEARPMDLNNLRVVASAKVHKALLNGSDAAVLADVVARPDAALVIEALGGTTMKLLHQPDGVYLSSLHNVLDGAAALGDHSRFNAVLESARARNDVCVTEGCRLLRATLVYVAPEVPRFAATVEATPALSCLRALHPTTRGSAAEQDAATVLVSHAKGLAGAVAPLATPQSVLPGVDFDAVLSLEHSQFPGSEAFAPKPPYAPEAVAVLTDVGLHDRKPLAARMAVPVSQPPTQAVTTRRLERMSRVLPLTHSSSLLWGRYGGQVGAASLASVTTRRGRRLKRSALEDAGKGAAGGDTFELDDDAVSFQVLQVVNTFREKMGAVREIIDRPYMSPTDVQSFRKTVGGLKTALTASVIHIEAFPPVAHGVLNAARRGPADGACRRLWAELVEFVELCAQPPATPRHVDCWHYIRWTSPLHGPAVSEFVVATTALATGAAEPVEVCEAGPAKRIKVEHGGGAVDAVVITT